MLVFPKAPHLLAPLWITESRSAPGSAPGSSDVKHLNSAAIWHPKLANIGQGQSQDLMQPFLDMQEVNDWRWHDSMAKGTGLQREHWRKSSQWFSLLRHHAEMAATDAEVNAAFETHCYFGSDHEDPSIETQRMNVQECSSHRNTSR
ncbi:hypothetical protein WJX84_000387 [Apatococcus fuscideae]|uniref:Uncharacterized protein n=1 Tax=Apatococcus fuscideae TaxID=2026836 RepID=A0AAW1SQN6_9CHLO